MSQYPVSKSVCAPCISILVIQDKEIKDLMVRLSGGDVGTGRAAGSSPAERHRGPRRSSCPVSLMGRGVRPQEVWLSTGAHAVSLG